ncbi:hypothetical protein [Deinococcus aquiradiocola]|uniref:hypothetical protein n=1 Tax=Deinococcus aquiradiocola TaxID=393059 RepID=UPI00166928B1|nr:hypothetical protein [Deinococcus aquiradiocola]
MTPSTQGSVPSDSSSLAVAQAYIRLAHGLDVHSPGYIDGYGGPAEWADRSERSPQQLQEEAARLTDLVAQVTDPARRTFLEVQSRAMHTLVRMLGGERLAYSEEVRGLYDIDPERADLAELEDGLNRMDAALPGSGTLEEREERLRARVQLDPDDVLRVTTPVLDELRRRTGNTFWLPEGEDFSIGLVRNQPWGGYNWPLGNLRSRIDINVDLPVLLPSLPDLMAHEGYPGHHTEHSGKEARLVRERGWHEHSIQLINAPECVVSEGIAVNALDAVMTPAEVREWLTGDLSRVAGLDPDDVRAWLALQDARESARGVNGHAALMLHEDHAPQAQVVEFLMRYNVVSEARALKSLEFITHPSFRSYTFTYSVGGRLVRRAMQAGAPREVFARLLTEPVTPGELAR